MELGFFLSPVWQQGMASSLKRNSLWTRLAEEVFPRISTCITNCLLWPFVNTHKTHEQSCGPEMLLGYFKNLSSLNSRSWLSWMPHQQFSEQEALGKQLLRERTEGFWIAGLGQWQEKLGEEKQLGHKPAENFRSCDNCYTQAKLGEKVQSAPGSIV